MNERALKKIFNLILMLIASILFGIILGVKKYGEAGVFWNFFILGEVFGMAIGMMINAFIVAFLVHCLVNLFRRLSKKEKNQFDYNLVWFFLILHFFSVHRFI